MLRSCGRIVGGPFVDVCVGKWVAMSGVPVAQSTRRERFAWVVYDWANQPFITTVMTVLGTFYLSRLASNAAGCGSGECSNVEVSFFGLPVPIGSLWAYTTSISVLLTVVLQPVVGARADRSSHKRWMLAGFAAVGSLAVASLLLLGPDSTRYQVMIVLIIVANVSYGCSIVVYNSFLPLLVGADGRDRLSATAWAWAYLAAAVFLTLNVLSINFAAQLGIDEFTAIQWGMAATGLWWAGWTIVVIRGLRDRPVPTQAAGSTWAQLKSTFVQLRATPATLLFLAAFLLYSDGISTVLVMVSSYADLELNLDSSTVTLAILLVQFVNFAGAYTMRFIASRVGAYRTVLGGLAGWTLVVVGAFWLPVGEVYPFFLLGVALGLVMGGTQALSRSLFTQLIPSGREAAYFGIYQIADRGTSWIGPLMLGVVVQSTGSMRVGILGIAVFFVVGFVLLSLVPMRRAIVAAGNEVPSRI